MVPINKPGRFPCAPENPIPASEIEVRAYRTRVGFVEMETEEIRASINIPASPENKPHTA